MTHSLYNVTTPQILFWLSHISPLIRGEEGYTGGFGAWESPKEAMIAIIEVLLQRAKGVMPGRHMVIADEDLTERNRTSIEVARIETARVFGKYLPQEGLERLINLIGPFSIMQASYLPFPLNMALMMSGYATHHFWLQNLKSMANTVLEVEPWPFRSQKELLEYAAGEREEVDARWSHISLPYILSTAFPDDIALDAMWKISPGGRAELEGLHDPAAYDLARDAALAGAVHVGGSLLLDIFVPVREEGGIPVEWEIIASTEMEVLAAGAPPSWVKSITPREMLLGFAAAYTAASLAWAWIAAALAKVYFDKNVLGFQATITDRGLRINLGDYGIGPWNIPVPLYLSSISSITNILANAVSIMEDGYFDPATKEIMEELGSHARFFHDVARAVSRVIMYGEKIRLGMPGAMEIVAQLHNSWDNVKRHFMDRAEMILEMPTP